MTSRVKMPPAWFYFLVQDIFKLLGAVLLKQDVHGREYIPEKGPFLVVFNHLSLVDAPLVLIHFPQQIVGMMTDKYYSTPFISQLGKRMGIIWVARGEADLGAIKASLIHLRSGGILAISPEGTRSPEGSLLKGKTGAAYLADRTRVPIVPVAIAGSENVFNNLRRWRRTPVLVSIGQPFHLPAEGRARPEKLEEYTDLIMRRLAELLPPAYRGEYAGGA